MILESVIDLAREYLLTGIIIVLVAVGLFCIYHFTIRKRLNKEPKKINKKRLIWWFVFLCYIFMVFSATMFNRGNMYAAMSVRPLLYSYKVAWNGWVSSEWRNIILNYVLFIPFGILLPIGYKFFRRFYKVALAGFLFSLFIEITQKITDLGIFELDDLLDNTLGAIIGYGFFMIGFSLYAAISGREEVKTLHMILSNIPFLLVLSAFIAILIAYDRQELGNNNNRYVVKYNSSLINVRGQEVTDDSITSLPVYLVDILDEDEATARASQIFGQLGKGENLQQSYYSDDLATFWPNGKNAILDIKYYGGTYEYTDYTKLGAEVVSFKKDEVGDILYSYGYGIISKAAWVDERTGHRFVFGFSMAEYNGRIWDGNIEVHLCSDKTIMDLKYIVYPLSYVRDFPAISKAEAYEMIKAGEFKRIDNGFLDIEILRCDLSYSVDTKGYYQPNYRFHCNINGNDAWIMIPALKVE